MPSVVEERRDGDSAERAECRSVRVTAPMVREVEISRSFLDPRAQENGLAVAFLLAAGYGLLSYAAAQQSACPAGGGCRGWATAGYATLGVAAIPIGFLAYNAARVQGSRKIERTESERVPGPWHTCSGERSLRDAELSAAP